MHSSGMFQRRAAKGKLSEEEEEEDANVNDDTCTERITAEDVSVRLQRGVSEAKPSVPRGEQHPKGGRERWLARIDRLSRRSPPIIQRGDFLLFL